MLNRFFLVGFGHLVVDFMMGIWPVYKTLAHLDIAKAGLIAGLSLFIGEGMQILFGLISDRGHHKKLFTIGIVLASGISFLAFTQNYLVLFLLVLSTFLGSGAFHPAAAGMVGNWSVSKKGILVSLFAVSGMIGAAMSQFIFTKSYMLFHGNTLIFLIPVLVVVAWSLWYPFPSLPLIKNKFSFREVFQSLAPVRKELVKLYCVQVLTQTILLSLLFLLPDLLRMRGFDDWYSLGGAYFCFVIGEIGLSIPAGYLTDKYNSRTILLIAVLGSLFTLYLFLLSPPLPLLYTSILLMILGGFMGLVNPVIVAAGSRLVPANTSSFISALLMGGASCIGGFGIVIVVFLTRFFSHEPMIKALEVMGLLFVASIFFLFSLERSYDKITQYHARS